LEIINLDPKNKTERAQIQEAKNVASLLMLTGLQPKIFKKRMLFSRSGWETYPLVMLCALGASDIILKAAYNANPSAIVAAAPLSVKNHVGFESLKRLVSQCKGCLVQQDEQGFTVLHSLVAIDAPLTFIQYFGTQGPEALKIKTFAHGWTPLHIACHFRTGGPIVELLTEMDETLNDNDSSSLATKHQSPEHNIYIIKTYLDKKYSRNAVHNKAKKDEASMDIIKLHFVRESSEDLAGLAFVD
jgi:hypothetical protein